MFRIIAFFFAFLIALVSGFMTEDSNGQQIGFLEDYVLSENRESALKQLVPGTEPYYYYHCLHYQNSRQLNKVSEMMKPWKKRSGETNLYRQIQNRQMMLIYPQTPEVSLNYIRKELSLNFNHQRQIPQAQRNLKSSLDQSLIDHEVLLQKALSRNGLEHLSPQGLKFLGNQKLSETQRLQLLKRLDQPNFPKLVDLVIADLRRDNGQSFGRLGIHQHLTLEQLDELARKRPEIKSESSFVFLYLSKLVPPNGVNWVADLDEYRKYLDRLNQFAQTLPPAYNSLKAHVTYRQLQLNLLQEKFDNELFMRYLQLPRNVYYANPKVIQRLRNRSHIAQLNSDYSKQTSLPLIGNDETLVKEYLKHFLRNADDFKNYEPYIRTEFLRQQFAEAKILAGIGDVEAWASMLTPEQYKALIERTDIDFASTNPRYLKADGKVELELFIKNIDTLIVKVFEINTENYYRKHRREIDTDINLDGLVPNFERTVTYDEAPSIRKRRKFEFPELDKRGVFIIDFIAGGISSRALIRKGRMEVIGNVNAAGHSMFVLDHFANKKLKDATLWIEGKRYKPDEDGDIQVPFSTQPGTTQAIVTQGDYSMLHEFNHRGESYAFNVGMLLDRENLTRGNKAKLLIRPSLQVAGAAPATVNLLKDHKLEITSVNLDGIAAKQEITDFEFKDNEETVCEFMVPPRTNRVTFNLTSKIKNFSNDREDTLRASQTFEINEIDKSKEIQDLHLVPTTAGYYLEVLGKSGEVRPSQSVRIEMNVNGFTQTVYTDLQSNDDGLIELGLLKNVNSLRVKPTVGKAKTWALETQDQTQNQTIHIAERTAIQIPAPAGLKTLDPKFVSLFELRQGRITHDVTDKMEIKKGVITIAGLTAANYQMRIDSPTESVGGRVRHDGLIRVSKGKNAQGVLVDDVRHLQTGNSQKVQIGTIVGNKSKVRIELENATENTRVHVIASRYQPAFHSFASIAAVTGIEPWIRRLGDLRSVYVQGRKIGDEYDYILRRKYANKFPGNMLERPSLLNNPWSPRETQNESQNVSEGGNFGGAGGAAGGLGSSVAAKPRSTKLPVDFSNLDFVGDGSVLLTNLRPNKAGVLTIDREALNGNQHIRIVAIEGFDTVQRNFNFKVMPLEPRDARLFASLEPDQHFSQSKQTELLAKGKTVRVDDLVSAKFQQYDDLGDVYTLLQSLNNNANLKQFRFILEWNDKNEEEKKELYSKYACHELNYFLSQKDTEFFKNVVLRHLKNKRVTTFMDQYLLRQNLEAFTRPWQFARLNTFEKILLAQRLEARTTDLIRSLNESYDISPTSRDLIDRYYDTSITALGLDAKSGGEREELMLRRESAKKSLKRKGMISGRSLGRQSGGRAGGGLAPSAQAFDAPMESADASEMMMENGVVDELKRSLGKRESKEKGLQGNFAGEDFDDSMSLGGKFAGGLGGGGQGGGGFGGGQFGNGKDAESLRDLNESLYRRVAATKEWIENNYYEIAPESQSPDLVSMNQFWRDYANHQDGAFLSPHFAEANNTFTSAMLALSVLDLPLKAAENKLEFADNSMTFTAGGPAIVLHQQVRAAKFERGDTKILVSENFYQMNDRYRFEDGVQIDKFVSDEFLAHTLYGSQVVITNPTSTPRQVELLVQIPTGSVACNGSQETKTTLLNLGPFTTQTFEYSFYFPTDGKYSHYPAHVSSDEEVLAVADGIAFNVVDRQAKLDEASWEFVSQNGTDDQVIDYINNQNVRRIDLSQIAFRMKDKASYIDILGALRNRYVYDSTLWSYGVKHDDVETVREFMSHSNPLTNNFGPEFHSELVSVDATERNWYGHKEYWPLVNARAHQLGPERKILNSSFHDQYQKLLGVLAQHQELSDDDHLVLTYYLLLQDRVETALEHFSKISEQNVNSKVQYLYCDAYLDFYRGQPEAAAAKASTMSNYPVDRWRKRFEAILAQVEEIKGGQTGVTDDKDQLQKQTEMAAKSESIDLEVANGEIRLKYQNVKSVKVNYYEMDIELLFSRSPFAQDDLDGFSMIRPNDAKTETLKLDKQGRGSQTIKLPASMKNKNVLVEVVAGDQVRSQPFFAHSLDVKMMENYGQLQVNDEKTGKAISKTYVKVYARMNDGTVRFHKDGYTDLRGRFDYATQSNRSPNGIDKLSILVFSSENGAITRQASMPKE